MKEQEELVEQAMKRSKKGPKVHKHGQKFDSANHELQRQLHKQN